MCVLVCLFITVDSTKAGMAFFFKAMILDQIFLETDFEAHLGMFLGTMPLGHEERRPVQRKTVGCDVIRVEDSTHPQGAWYMAGYGVPPGAGGVALAKQLFLD